MRTIPRGPRAEIIGRSAQDQGADRRFGRDSAIQHPALPVAGENPRIDVRALRHRGGVAERLGGRLLQLVVGALDLFQAQALQFVAFLGVASYAAPLLSTLALIAGGQAEAKPVLLLAALLITFGAVLAARASLSQKPVQAD